MNPARKNILLFFLIVIVYDKTLAQDINGFKIFVSDNATTSIYFNSKITDAELEDKGKSIYKILPIDSIISINANKATRDTFSLKVTEGTRNHHFLIVYKKNIDTSEMEYHYSDLKKLEQQVNLNQKEKEDDENYETASMMGDSLLFIDPNKSLMWFEKADTLKPNDAIIQNRIKYLKGQLAKQDSIQLEQKKAQNRREAMSAYNEALSALKEANFEKAELLLHKYLDLIDTTDFNILKVINQERVVNFAKDKIKDIEDDRARKKTGTLKKDSLIKSDDVKNKNDSTGSAPKPDSLKNTDNNFLQDSSESKLHLKDSVDKIKLTWAGLNFKDSTVFIKVLIQNNDTAKFSIGTLLLSLNRKDGNVTLLPVKFYNIPVLAGEEKEIICETKAIELSDEESFTFQLSDQEEKIKLEITIPGEIYNREKKKLAKL